MPEAPDLEVIKEFLERNVMGRRFESAKVLKPTVVRSLAGDFSEDIPGRTLERVHRQGKFLLFEMSGDRWLAINPMLTGALQYTHGGQRGLKKTCDVFGF